MAKRSKPELRLPGDEHGIGRVRTFETIINIEGWPDTFDAHGEGKMDDLPASYQDAIYKAMELKSKQLNLPLAVVLVRVDEDHDVPKGTHGHFFLHIILSEVVAVPQIPKRMLN